MARTKRIDKSSNRKRAFDPNLYVKRLIVDKEMNIPKAALMNKCKSFTTISLSEVFDEIV